MLAFINPSAQPEKKLSKFSSAFPGIKAYSFVCEIKTVNHILKAIFQDYIRSPLNVWGQWEQWKMSRKRTHNETKLAPEYLFQGGGNNGKCNSSGQYCTTWMCMRQILSLDMINQQLFLLPGTQSRELGRKIKFDPEPRATLWLRLRFE